MTTLLLPNGTRAELRDLNPHDLAQYYMYQMDMLEQTRALYSSLGIEDWAEGTIVEKGYSVDRQETHPSEFLVTPSAGNLMPTHYDASTWQGMHKDEKGFKSWPFVDQMTPDAVRLEIERQQTSLLNVQLATAALANLARNIADATQPPEAPEPA